MGPILTLELQECNYVMVLSHALQGKGHSLWGGINHRRLLGGFSGEIYICQRQEGLPSPERRRDLTPATEQIRPKAGTIVQSLHHY